VEEGEEAEYEQYGTSATSHDYVQLGWRSQFNVGAVATAQNDAEVLAEESPDEGGPPEGVGRTPVGPRENHTVVQLFSFHNLRARIPFAIAAISHVYSRLVLKG
jgi:hypothetical protein